mmetsp:Transcript_1854/g.5536  ORF Transcript_1854/g.5536 Transcript_1854/m.5536 type:complete len:154 (-) Transcript_1854:197-658(-)
METLPMIDMAVQHLQVLRIGPYTVLFVAEVDAVDKYGRRTEVGLGDGLQADGLAGGRALERRTSTPVRPRAYGGRAGKRARIVVLGRLASGEQEKKDFAHCQARSALAARHIQHYRDWAAEGNSKGDRCAGQFCRVTRIGFGCFCVFFVAAQT